MNKGRRSIRLKEYDYSRSGCYFITICTNGHKNLFGKIENNKTILNRYGEIVEYEWLRTGQIRDNIVINEYIIMPNHIHGIIKIENPTTVGARCFVPTRRGTMLVPNSQNTIKPDITSDIRNNTQAQNTEHFGKPTSNSIPTIIRGFKSTITNQINQIDNAPGHPIWQRNYYEHIIRNEKSYREIAEYIINNPRTWTIDKLYQIS